MDSFPAKKQEKKVMLHEKAAEELRRIIVDGSMQPGEKLPSEAELALQIDVGRTSVREALKLLSNEGFVDVRRGSGNYVGRPKLGPTVAQLAWHVQVDECGLEHMLEMRLILELGVAPLVIDRAQPVHLDQMSLAIWEARQAYEQGETDLRPYDLQFHQAYLMASGNFVAKSFGGSLREFFQNKTYEQMVKRTKSKAHKTIQEHVTIHQSIMLGDLDMLRRTLISHLNRRKTIPHSLVKEFSRGKNSCAEEDSLRVSDECADGTEEV